MTPKLTQIEQMPHTMREDLRGLLGASWSTDCGKVGGCPGQPHGGWDSGLKEGGEHLEQLLKFSFYCALNEFCQKNINLKFHILEKNHHLLV